MDSVNDLFTPDIINYQSESTAFSLLDDQASFLGEPGTERILLNSSGQEFEDLSLIEQEIIQNKKYSEENIFTFLDGQNNNLNQNNYDSLTGSNETEFRVTADASIFFESEVDTAYVKTPEKSIQNTELSLSQKAIVVPGKPNQIIQATLSLSRGNTDYQNEMGLFLVDDETGRIGDLLPSDPGYATVALSPERRLLILPHGNQTVSTQINSGSYLGSYLIQNNTTSNFLASNPTNNLQDSPVAFFNFLATNPDNFDHLQATNVDDNTINLSWEDLTGGGDKDFNDLEVRLSFADTTSGTIEGIKWQDLNGDGIRNGITKQTETDSSIIVKEKNTLFLSGEDTQQITTTFSVLNHDTIYENEMGLFLVDDETGRIGDLLPSDPGYATVALSPERRLLILPHGRQIVSTEINGNSYLGSYLIQNSTTEDFLGSNSTNNLDKKPLVFFNFTATNPDSFDHLQTNSTGDKSINLVWEDLNGGGDQDFNDLVVQVSITNTPSALTQDIISDSVEPGLAGVEIYLDLNNNNILDDNEPVQITAEDNPETIDTDETGKYRFTDLDSGNYVVREVIPDGYEQTAPNDGVYIVEVEPGKIVKNIDFGNILVNNPSSNYPPVFTSTPIVDARVNTEYQYQSTASDPDGDSLTYTVVNAPKGMSVDKNTGLVSWTPIAEQLGEVAVTLQVEDGRGGVTTQTYKILTQQEQGNHAPIIISEPTTDSYLYDVNAIDPDQDILTYSLETTLEGVTIDPQTREINWSGLEPTEESYPLTVRVEDGRGGVDTQKFAIAFSDDPLGEIKGNIWDDINGNGVRDRGIDSKTPVDLVILQDTTGSFQEDLPTVSSLIPNLTTSVRAIQPDTQFGIASFGDKQLEPFGGLGGYFDGFGN